MVYKIMLISLKGIHLLQYISYFLPIIITYNFEHLIHYLYINKIKMKIYG